MFPIKHNPLCDLLDFFSAMQYFSIISEYCTNLRKDKTNWEGWKGKNPSLASLKNTQNVYFVKQKFPKASHAINTFFPMGNRYEHVH